MDEKRIFPMSGELTLDEIVRLLEQYLNVQKHLTTQKFTLGNKAILQCIDSDSNWKQFIGLDAAVTVELEETPQKTLIVKIGSAKWLDKIGVAAMGALVFNSLVFNPLAVVAGIGAIRQAVLPTEIFTFIEGKTGKTSARPTYTAPFSTPAPEEETAVCPCCGTQVNKSHAFCSKCGTKL